MGHSESCCKSLLVSVPISYNRRDLLIAPHSTHESSRKEEITLQRVESKKYINIGLKL